MTHTLYYDTKDTMKLNIIKIKARLKRLRRNQSWLADAMGISKQLLSHRLKSEKIVFAEDIAKAIGVRGKSLIKEEK